MPYPSNEPVNSYTPGTPERENLLNKYKEMYNQKPIHVPLYIGGEEIETDNKLKINDSIFPYNMIGKWDKNNYGSIVIPYKGLRVVLNQTNFNHYKDIIETYENHKIDYRDLKYFCFTLKKSSAFISRYSTILNGAVSSVLL